MSANCIHSAAYVCELCAAKERSLPIGKIVTTAASPLHGELEIEELARLRSENENLRNQNAALFLVNGKHIAENEALREGRDRNLRLATEYAEAASCLRARIDKLLAYNTEQVEARRKAEAERAHAKELVDRLGPERDRVVGLLEKLIGEIKGCNVSKYPDPADAINAAHAELAKIGVKE